MTDSLTMSKTRVLLGTALVLSLAALLSVVTRPRPVVAGPGQVARSSGSAVKIEARSSHTAVHERGSELFAELTVTLDGEVKGADHVALALVLDHSGSMSGQKMLDARKAAHRLVDLLQDGDELALISFGSDVTVTDRQRLDATTRATFHAAIDQVEASGSTFISGGMQAGWQALRGASGARRLVLVSDGQPTVGLTDEGSLANLTGQVHADAITVTALGVGSDYDGLLMQHLAERGGGMYGYLKDASALEEVLGLEVTAARLAVARNVELTLDTTDFNVLEVPGRHLDWSSGKPVLHLADLRPAMPTRVFVRVQSKRMAVGDHPRLEARVQWRAVEGGAQTSAVSLALTAVDDAQQVEASRDEAVYARGITAVGSVKLVAAAAAYERGDVAQATSLFDSARAVFGMSADALAGQTEVEEVRKSFGSADASGRKDLARKLERKKLVDFGRDNEGY